MDIRYRAPSLGLATIKKLSVVLVMKLPQTEWSHQPLANSFVGDGSVGGRTDRGGAPAPPETPIASAFGDTDGEIFGRKCFRPKNFSAERCGDEC